MSDDMELPGGEGRKVGLLLDYYSDAALQTLAIPAFVASVRPHPSPFRRMPELPEVETTRRGVAPRVIGKRVARVTVYDRRLRWPVPQALESRLRGHIIERVDRRSKYLLFRIGEGTLLVHLGMTGSLRVYAEPPPRRAHDHADVVLDDGTLLRYHDPRRFGAILWVPAASEHPLLRHLGPEPFDAAFDAAYLWRATRGRRAAIKLALMDNRLVVGVGNIYASEALFRAGIRPAIAAGRLTRPRLIRLVDAVRAVLAEAIAKGGSTLRNYVDSDGDPGSFQLTHYVYGRAGDPCRVCRTGIRQVRLGQRSSFYCPRCQH
jgi:formamidopyrimidine-DNA glycosylase